MKFESNKEYMGNLSLQMHARKFGSFENEALENEDRSAKHPNLENEAPKSRKRSTLNWKPVCLLKHETVPCQVTSSRNQAR